MKKKKVSKEKQALIKIAEMGKGYGLVVSQWAMIGREATDLAQDVIAGKCKTCGQQKEYK